MFTGAGFIFKSNNAIKMNKQEINTERIINAHIRVTYTASIQKHFQMIELLISYLKQIDNEEKELDCLEIENATWN